MNAKNPNTRLVMNGGQAFPGGVERTMPNEHASIMPDTKEHPYDSCWKNFLPVIGDLEELVWETNRDAHLEHLAANEKSSAFTLHGMNHTGMVDDDINLSGRGGLHDTSFSFS